VRDLASGNPDPALLPDLAAALARVSGEHALYGDEPVEPRLLELGRTELGSLGIPDDHLGRVAGAEGETTLHGRTRWALVRSVAKSLGPDLRLALLAGDSETVSRVRGRQQLGTSWVSHVLQRLVVELLSAPEINELLARAERAYAACRAELVAALAARGIAAHGRTGFNVWVPVPDETAAVQALLASGRAVMPGLRYRLESPPAIRVTVSTLRPDEADEIAGVLAAALVPSARTRAA